MKPTTMIRARSWLLGRDDGATALETALTLFVLVIFIVGIFEFGFGYWVLNSMQLAVSESGRYAMAHRVNTDGSCNLNNVVSQTNTIMASYALPQGLSFTGPYGVSTPYVSCVTGNCNCTSTVDPTNPPRLSISVSYTNSFLSMFNYSIGSADTVPLE
jgi:Flp pilus assembly protein TadG